MNNLDHTNNLANNKKKKMEVYAKLLCTPMALWWTMESFKIITILKINSS